MLTRMLSLAVELLARVIQADVHAVKWHASPDTDSSPLVEVSTSVASETPEWYLPKPLVSARDAAFSVALRIFPVHLALLMADLKHQIWRSRRADSTPPAQSQAWGVNQYIPQRIWRDRLALTQYTNE